MSEPAGHRPKRLNVHTAVLLSRGPRSWTSEVIDISATGISVRRPDDFAGRENDLFVLDMVDDSEMKLHFECVLRRVDEAELGFSFASIPPEKEVPLWTLLGGAADAVEPFDKT
jgi:hypothetical protein